MLTITELLDSELYSKWLHREPKLTPTAATTPPWFVYLQRSSGKWARLEVPVYADALQVLLDWQEDEDFIDGALCSKRQEFKPPVIKRNGTRLYWPLPQGHGWCGYCRRPVVFNYFGKHHAFPKSYAIATDELRCPICGIKKSSLRRYYRN